MGVFVGSQKVRLTACMLLLLGPVSGAQGPPSTDQVNEANNPLTPKITVNLQDQYVASCGLDDSDSKAILFRAVLPHKLLGWPQILRATVPIVTSPDEPFGSETGLGDINVFDTFLFKAGPLELGIGPQFTFPSATDDRLGTGKWQAGAAVLAAAPQSWGLLGGLVTYQHSFAGDDDQPTQSGLQAQPFVIVNLPQGFYLRSTATWNLDLEQDTYHIPVGFGVGKVWVLKGRNDPQSLRRTSVHGHARRRGAPVAGLHGLQHAVPHRPLGRWLYEIVSPPLA